MTEIVYEGDADIGVLPAIRDLEAEARIRLDPWCGATVTPDPKSDLVGRDSGQYRHRHG